MFIERGTQNRQQPFDPGEIPPFGFLNDNLCQVVAQDNLRVCGQHGWTARGIVPGAGVQVCAIPVQPAIEALAVDEPVA